MKTTLKRTLDSTISFDRDAEVSNLGVGLRHPYQLRPDIDSSFVFQLVAVSLNIQTRPSSRTDLA